MEAEKIQEQLKKIVKTYLPEDVPEIQIGPESDLTRELNINSAHLVDVALDIEDEFDIEIDNEAMEKMTTINASVKIIQEKLVEK